MRRNLKSEEVNRNWVFTMQTDRRFLSKSFPL
jgi:hypothetical protein